MAIGLKHLEKNGRSRRRERKDIVNQKGRLKIRLAGEDDKHNDEEVVGKIILTFGEIDLNIHFEISPRPTGMEGDPPIFVKIKEIEAPVSKSGFSGSVHKVHNCRNLQNNKTTWLPAVMQVVIVE